MKQRLGFHDVPSFVEYLKRQRKQRSAQNEKTAIAGRRRQNPSKKQRADILKITGGKCHICGGKISKNESWQADHVLAHAQGGDNSSTNFLPAHSICNHYRWYYGHKEFQLILKLGVWLRTKMEKPKPDTYELIEEFVKKELKRESRSKKSRKN